MDVRSGPRIEEAEVKVIRYTGEIEIHKVKEKEVDK